MKKYFLVLTFCVMSAAPAFSKEFKVDEDHSMVAFGVKHLGVTNVKGLFKKFSGDLSLDDKTKKLTKVSGSVDASTIDTRNDKRDEHLKSPDFFEVSKDKNSQISFQMKKYEGDNKGGKIIGDLTMKGVKKEVILNATVSDIIQDPWGAERLAITARGNINRQDFGINFNKTFGKAGDFVVANNVDLELDIEAIAKTKK